MAKVSKVRRKNTTGNRKCSPLTFHCSKISKKVEMKTKGPKALEKKLWKSCNCSVCMEYPHNAVLLLCSSYNKGCHPYMCATSHRYSNCLEQYKKAYSKALPNQVTEAGHGDGLGFSVGLDCLGKNVEISELLCPLCRGQVKGWTVVEPARKYFNTKRRACMKEKCSFVGNYKELRKHVRVEHPSARPREVDPKLAEKWNRLEQEREREDVISTIQSSTPGAIVMGDYVIETNFRRFFGGFNANMDDPVLGWQSMDVYSDDSLESDDGSSDEDGDVNGSLFSGYRNSWSSRRLSRGRGSRASSRGR